MSNTDSAPSPRQTIASSISQIEAEQRWFKLMRLSFGWVCACWVLLLSWALPWGPINGMVPDYSAAAVLGVILAIGATASTSAFLFLWRPSFVNETVRDFVAVLFGGSLLLRNRSQFEARLAAECRRARRSGAAFSLVVVRAEGVEAPAATNTKPSAVKNARQYEGSLVALLGRGIARSGDIVGDAAPGEVWILALGADEEARAIIVDRIDRLSASWVEAFPALTRTHVGGSTFGTDAQAPGEILRIAYGPLASGGVAEAA